MDQKRFKKGSLISYYRKDKFIEGTPNICLVLDIKTDYWNGITNVYLLNGKEIQKIDSELIIYAKIISEFHER